MTATQMNVSARRGCPWLSAPPTKPTAPRQSSPIVCQRRSPVRSLDQPAAIFASKPSEYGKDTSKVTASVDKPESDFTIVGSQNPRPLDATRPKKYAAEKSSTA